MVDASEPWLPDEEALDSISFSYDIPCPAVLGRSTLLEHHLFVLAAVSGPGTQDFDHVAVSMPAYALYRCFYRQS